MGKKRTKIIDLSKTEDNKAKASQKIQDLKAAGKKIVEPEEKTGKTVKSKTQKSKRKRKLRSIRYKTLKTKVDEQKLYPLAEAIKLLVSLANSKIDETVEVHFSTFVKKLTGKVKLPYGTGKKQKVAIADEKLIDKIRDGKIDFDILIAGPQIMPKIAQVASILGPKGLMPNPKTGTITDKPEELKKKLLGGEIHFKTEAKNPLLHLIIGKISFGEEKLLKNLEALIKAVEPRNIKKAVLTSTMSPGIKLKIS